MKLSKNEFLTTLLFAVIAVGQIGLSSTAFSQNEIMPMESREANSFSPRDLFIKTDLDRAKQSLQLALENAPKFIEAGDVTAIEVTRNKSGFIAEHPQIEIFRKTSNSVLELCSASADIFQNFAIEKCNAVTNFEYIFRELLQEMKLNQNFFDSLKLVMNSKFVFARVLNVLEGFNLDRINRISINRSKYSDDYGLFNLKIDILAEGDGKTLRCVGNLEPQIDSTEVSNINYRSFPTINFRPKEDLVCGDKKRGQKN